MIFPLGLDRHVHQVFHSPLLRNRKSGGQEGANKKQLCFLSKHRLVLLASPFPGSAHPRPPSALRTFWRGRLAGRSLPPQWHRTVIVQGRIQHSHQRNALIVFSEHPCHFVRNNSPKAVSTEQVRSITLNFANL